MANFHEPDKMKEALLQAKALIPNIKNKQKRKRLIRKTTQLEKYINSDLQYLALRKAKKDKYATS